MTDFLSRLREAIETYDKAIHWSRHPMWPPLLAAARCFSEGEPLQWCDEHGVSTPHGQSHCWLKVIDLKLGEEETPCHIVSQWRCPPPEGGD